MRALYLARLRGACVEGETHTGVYSVSGYETVQARGADLAK